MGIHKYFQSLSDLEGIYRCPGVFKYQEHSVASHSFKVATIVQFLATVEDQHGQKVDWKTVYEKAINHDYSELFTGDIKTPVKYALPKLRELFSQVEGSMTQEYLDKEFPQEFRQVYEARFKEGKDRSLEGKILAVADKIDLLYEAYGEIQKGNPEPLFFQIYKEALTSIVQFNDLASVRYFIQVILKEMIEEEITSHSRIKSITEQLLSEKNTSSSGDNQA
ncbi:HD domain-containing protein [Sporolactobacillus laevolacticus]|uniref:HD domain-containing protein n=1 Tax=Sporolactobacillus laevolacticus TaxID=33018 RepID=UPI0025B4183A|nr:HD domain-containing protein [Sporolactobacillus laevolacticus]MDN3956698.1 HD domain-containing protein [Sporolactobacillus laevolacticus]